MERPQGRLDPQGQRDPQERLDPQERSERGATRMVSLQASAPLTGAGSRGK